MRTLLRYFGIFSLALIVCAQAFTQTKPKFSTPVLITSAGQSADVTIAGKLFSRLSLNAKTSAMAKPAELDGIKTLVIVAGFSSKGLGAAGISREQELARVKDMIASAKEKKIPVMLMHIGGKPRRGNQSDDFNKIAAESSSYMLVVKQGDEDQFFSSIASKGKIGIELIEKIRDAEAPLGAIFK